MTGILFDLDGTLLDTMADLTDAVNYALGVHGYPSRTMDEVRSFVGTALPDCWPCPYPKGRIISRFWPLTRPITAPIARSRPGLIPAWWRPWPS